MITKISKPHVQIFRTMIIGLDFEKMGSSHQKKMRDKILNLWKSVLNKSNQNNILH